jgi:sulfoxide reductase heme-binding subunit YedZ
MRRAWRTLVAVLSAIANWRWFTTAVLVACLVPGVLIAYDLCQLFLWNHPEALGPDPAKALQHETGEDALGILFATLAVTPVRRVFKINRVQIVRRMLGVTAFFYALAHVLTYLIFDQLCYSTATCDLAGTWADILKRRFIFAGMVAFLSMLVLAVTSTSGWVRRLRKNWIRLHRLVYVAAVAAVIHFIWIQKSDISEPMNWVYWLTLLFGIRVFFWWQKRPKPQVVGQRPLAPGPRA